MIFKGNAINNLVLTMEINATSTLMKNSWSLISATYDKKYTSIEKDGVKVTTKSDVESYKYTVTIDADPAKATKENLDKYGMGSLAGDKNSIENVQKSLESSGFSCKK